jgi:hypothetical protein
MTCYLGSLCSLITKAKEDTLSIETCSTTLRSEYLAKYQGIDNIVEMLIEHPSLVPSTKARHITTFTRVLNHPAANQMHPFEQK